MNALALAKNRVFRVKKQDSAFGLISYSFALRVDRPESPDPLLADFIGQALSPPTTPSNASGVTGSDLSSSSPRLPTHPPHLRPGPRSLTPPRMSGVPLLRDAVNSRSNCRVPLRLFESSLSSSDTQPSQTVLVAEQSTTSGSRAEQNQNADEGQEDERRKSSKRRRLLSSSEQQEAEEPLEHSPTFEQLEQQLAGSTRHMPSTRPSTVHSRFGSLHNRPI